MQRLLIAIFIITQIVLGCKKDDSKDDLKDDECLNRFYYYDSGKIILTEIPNRGVISFYDTLPAETINQIIDQYGEISVVQIRSNGRHAIISIDSDNCTKTDKLFTTIKSDSRVSNCHKFLTSGEISWLGIFDTFICKLKNSTTQSQVTELINKTKTEIIESRTSSYRYVIRADKNSIGDALDMANVFFESGYFEFAEPEFISNWTTY